ncbi:17543_t:CDS:2, partial [Funneliformis geosporum]
MRIIGTNLLTNLLSLLFAIILCVFPLYTTAQNTNVRIFAHEETIDYGKDSLPRVWRQRVYDDGTTVVRIVRRNPAIQGVCLIEKLFLRIIHLDGTVEEKDIDLGIQPFNYCIFTSDNAGVIGTNVEFLDYHLIRKNQILVTYHNATDINDYYTYEEWGMIINFDGKVLNRTPFGFAFVEPVTQKLIPNSEIKLNVNPEKGFLRIASVRNTTNAEWQQYLVEPDGVITKLTSGMLGFENFNSLMSTVISTVDEGYAIVFANTSSTGFKESDPLSPLGLLFVLPIGYNQLPVAPLALYQTSVQVNFTSLFCDILSVGVGQVCTLTAKQKDPATLQDNVFYIKVNFLSSGSVTSFKVINRLFPAIKEPAIIGVDWVVASLPYGGYLLSNTFKTTGVQGTLIYGFLFGEDDANYLAWNLEEPQPSNTKGVFSVLKNNNTLMMAQFETTNSWSFNVIDLPKFSDRDNGKKETFASSTSGLVRLTVEGTKFYDNLSSEEQAKFFDTLLIELAASVPVSPSRLHSNKKIQPDNSLNDHPYFISIGIEETEGGNEKSVESIIKILQTMINHKDQTPIGFGDASKYLDSSYGFNPSPDLWDKYKYRLLGVFLVIGLLIVLFLFAQRRDSKIYYRINTVTYDIIPLLTLISSALNLTINIIGRLYQATNRVRHGKNNNSNTSDEEFGGLDKITSKEVPNSVSERNYLGDGLKLDNPEESSNNSKNNQ